MTEIIALTTSPTAMPTTAPTAMPTEPPTEMPTATPTEMPTVAPTSAPTPQLLVVQSTQLQTFEWSGLYQSSRPTGK